MSYELLIETNNGLYHSGIPGMKWGIRKYQNEDGSLTEAGKVRYGVGTKSDERVQRKIKDDKNRAQVTEKADTYRQSQSKGREITKDILLGPAASMTYDMARAHGEGRGKALVRSIFDINGARLLGALASGAASSVAVKAAGGSTGISGLAGFAAGTAAAYATRSSAGSLQQRAMRKKYGTNR